MGQVASQTRSRFDFAFQTAHRLIATEPVRNRASGSMADTALTSVGYAFITVYTSLLRQRVLEGALPIRCVLIEDRRRDRYPCGKEPIPESRPTDSLHVRGSVRRLRPHAAVGGALSRRELESAAA
jgi:hypothetical protein